MAVFGTSKYLISSNFFHKQVAKLQLCELLDVISISHLPDCELSIFKNGLAIKKNPNLVGVSGVRSLVKQILVRRRLASQLLY